MLEELADFYQTDLSAPDSHILKDEAQRYQRQWSKVDQSMCPANLRGVLKQYDKDSHPNLHTLLRTGCTLPVTTAESERANSVLKLVKMALRSRIGDEWLSSLIMLKVHAWYNAPERGPYCQFVLHYKATEAPQLNLFSDLTSYY